MNVVWPVISNREVIAVNQVMCYVKKERAALRKGFW